MPKTGMTATELPADSPIRTDPLFAKLRAHRKIDHLNVVTSNLPPELSNAGDFSRSSNRGPDPRRLRGRHEPGHR
jgi:hypothetical protein